jgi:LysM repeat protein
MSFAFKKTGARRAALGVVSALLALAVLFSSLTATALASPASQSASCAKTHTVVAGDTLSGISATYNVSIAEIAAANSLTEPYALTIGQSLCIPGAAAAASTPAATTTGNSAATTSSGTDPNFTFSVANNFITISTANLPTKSVYFVKVGEGSVRNNQWTKIGRLATKKNTELTSVYKMPKGLRNSVSITICLKNLINDDLLCKRGATGVTSTSNR